MGTPEILVVLAALMALISLVGIGIDWIGKPLRNRRFVPRIYRYDDEKLPVDALGHTQLPSADYLPTQPPMPRPVPYSMPPGSAAAPLGAGSGSRALPVVPSLPNVPAVPPVPLVPAALGATLRRTPGAKASPSAFSDTVAPPQSTHREPAFSDTVAPPQSTHREPVGGDDEPGGERTWRPGLPLDIRVGDRKPTLADKAQRFWRAASEHTGPTHFDEEDHARMSIGKAPRRFNPRTARSEAMQLGGLRQASAESDVMMRWPDESVDPWSAR